MVGLLLLSYLAGPRDYSEQMSKLILVLCRPQYGEVGHPEPATTSGLQLCRLFLRHLCGVGGGCKYR